jgi:hypothetical protein
LLTGLKLGQNESFEDACSYIERIKRERPNFEVQFMGSKNRDAPFHDRFIISKNKCWNVGTSLKQLGKGKDSAITEVSLTEKEEKIEPAFDLFWEYRRDNLNKKGFIKLSYDEWKFNMGEKNS